MGESFSGIASSASNAAAAISGNGTAQAAGGQAQAAGGTAGNPDAKTPSAAGGQTSLKAALEDLSTESVDNIHKISDAFAGEDSEGTSVTGAIKKVTDMLGSTDSDNAEPDSLMAVLNEQAALALDEEKGIPAQTQAWEGLNEPLGQAAETVAALKEALEDMDGKAFSVTLNVLGNGGTLADSISGNYNTPENNGQTPSNTAAQPIPFPHENDHSKFAEIYRKFTAAMEDPARRTDFIAAAPKLNPVSQFTGLTSQSNYSSLSTNTHTQQTVTQNITLNCPNVTNNSGIEYIQKELGNLSLRALQESMKH